MLLDTGTKFPVTTYGEQYRRAGNKQMSNLQGYDADMAEGAALLEENAKKGQLRRMDPVSLEEVG